MEVCYAYGGIGQVIMGMTPSDWAAWFSGIVTAAAVWSGFLLYRRTRTDAQADLAARRRVLHAMLREHVRLAAKFVPGALERVQKMDRNIDRQRLRLYMRGFELPNAQRLIELQANLVDFGEAGDETIAAFIEACREYDRRYRGWFEHVFSPDELIMVDSGPLALHAIESDLTRLSSSCAPALAAIERLDQRPDPRKGFRWFWSRESKPG